MLRSLAISVLVSALATAAARRMLSVSRSEGEERNSAGNGTIVVVVPVLVGCSNNRIGWVSEEHRHPLFGRTGN